MRTARFTESRWWRSCAGLIAPVSAAAKRHGLDEQTLYTWRKLFGGFQASDGRSLKQLGGREEVVAERPPGAAFIS